MKIDIRKISEFFKFVMIRSIMKWEKKNKITLCKKGELDIKFLVNDEEMDVVNMFDSIEKNMDEYIENKAKEMFDDKFFDFESEMTDVIDEVMDNIKIKMLKKRCYKNKNWKGE